MDLREASFAGEIIPKKLTVKPLVMSLVHPVLYRRQTCGVSRLVSLIRHHWGTFSELTLSVGLNNRRRIYTEERAKVVTVVWGSNRKVFGEHLF